MFAAFIAVLLVLWLAGMATSYTLGGFIHILPAAAVLGLLLKTFWDRRPLGG